MIGEDFEPTRVVPAETETGGLIGSEAPSPPAPSPGPSLTPDEGEGVDPAGVLDPAGMGVNGTNSAASGADAGRDGGVEPADGGEPGAFDASAPDAAAASSSASPPGPAPPGPAPPSPVPPSASLLDAGAPTSTEPPLNEPPLNEPGPPEPCPGIVFEGACYEFLGERVSWDVAEARCVAWGGHLASIETFEEDAFIGVWPALLGVAAGDGSGIWLGGFDERQDGDFRWADERPLSFLGWAPNQPDNGQGVDCIQKRNDGAGRWYDLRCSDAQPYVCERTQ